MLWPPLYGREAHPIMRQGMTQTTFVYLLGLVATAAIGAMLFGVGGSFFNTFAGQTNTFNELMDNVTDSEGITADLITARQSLAEGIEYLHLGRVDEANSSFKEAERNFNQSLQGLEVVQNQDAEEEYLETEGCFLGSINPLCSETDTEALIEDYVSMTEQFRDGTGKILEALQHYDNDEHTLAENDANDARDIFSLDGLSGLNSGLSADDDMPYRILFLSEPTFVSVSGAPIQYSIERYTTGANIYPILRASEMGIEATSMHIHHLIDAYLRNADRRASEIQLRARNDDNADISDIADDYVDFMQDANSLADEADGISDDDSNVNKKAIDENILRATAFHAQVLEVAYDETSDSDIQSAIETAGCEAHEQHNNAGSRIEGREQATELDQGGLEDGLPFDC